MIQVEVCFLVGKEGYNTANADCSINIQEGCVGQGYEQMSEGDMKC